MQGIGKVVMLGTHTQILQRLVGHVIGTSKGSTFRFKRKPADSDLDRSLKLALLFAQNR